MAKSPSDSQGSPTLHLLCGFLLVAVWGAMVAAVLGLPDVWDGLLPKVMGRLGCSGVEHPVTAVLLNFRSYDTLLEIMVLFLAVLGAWSLGTVEGGRSQTPAGPVLSALVRILLPLLVLASVYLLHRGATAPGGAFQAGAVLATAGVLYLLSDMPLSHRGGARPLRSALIAGPGVFFGVAAATLLLGNAFLEYPPAWAKALIVMVEWAATLSIAVTLVVLFAGGRPRHTPSVMAERGADGLDEE